MGKKRRSCSPLWLQAGEGCMKKGTTPLRSTTKDWNTPDAEGKEKHPEKTAEAKGNDVKKGNLR